MNMKNTYSLIIFLLAVTFSFQAFSQSARLRQLVDNTGVTISAVAPADTSLVWHHPDGGSYVWDVGTQEWKEIKYEYDFDSYTSILGAKIPLGSTVRTPYMEYVVQPDSINGFPIDTIWTIPLSYGYAIHKQLLDQTIAITEELIGDTSQNNYILQKAAYSAKIANVIAYKSVTITLPAKKIPYSKTWKIVGAFSHSGIDIIGKGRSNSANGYTSLFYNGADSVALYVSDMTKCIIKNFDLSTNSKFAMYLDTFISHVQINEITFFNSDSTDGAFIEANRYTSNQISEIYVENCRFAGNGGGNNDGPNRWINRGISGGLANNKNFYINKCEFLNIDTAIHIYLGGTVEIASNNFANNYMDIYSHGNNTLCQNNYSEESRKFYGSGFKSAMSPQILINNKWASYVSVPLDSIVINGAGYLTLINNSFESTTSTPTRIRWQVVENSSTPSNNANKIFAVGNFFNGCNNTTNRWLVDGANNYPTNASKSLKAWSNRGGENNSSGIQLDDLFSIWETDAAGIRYESSTAGELVFVNGAKIQVNNWTSGTGVLAITTGNLTGAAFSGQSGQTIVNESGRPQLSFTSFTNPPNMYTYYNETGGVRKMQIGIGFANSPNITSWAGDFSLFVDGQNSGSGGFFLRKGSVNGRITDGTGLMSVTNAGNLYIGNSTAIERLEVPGNCVISGTIYLNVAKTLGIFTGTGSPEGAVSASVGSVFHRTDGGAGTSYYVKESGAGNTGWVAK